VLARRPGHALSEIAQVGSDGSFHFRDLAPGTYELRTGDLEAGIKVEVRPGQTSSVRIARPN